MLRIDGSFGEGGGQIVRSSLALSMVTGTPIALENIRARRKRPGLRRQHLTAVEAAARISSARLEGARIGSTSLELEPQAIVPGHYHFAVGTAGSATLVLQTVLPALLTAKGESTLVLEGGTHNPMAPPYPFLADTFLPLLRRMGPEIEATLERPGFYPAGGGRIRVTVRPSETLQGFELHQRGKIRRQSARALVARLPRHIGERELKTVQKKLGWGSADLHLEEISDSDGPGNVLVLQVESESLAETFIAFGQVGVRAEQVAQRAVRELRSYLKSGVPVGEHLADQLMLPLALAGGGAFTTLPLSRHSTTQIEIIRRFLEIPIEVRKSEQRAVVILG